MENINLLKEVWIYSPTKVKTSGEYTTSWNYKLTAYLNIQQDFNDLDRNSAGEIDYDVIKCRTTKTYDIAKSDGLYIASSSVNKDEVKPQYIVESMPKVGRTTTYTCNKNLGE